MDKLSALSELKSLIEKGLLRYSEYDIIQNVTNKTDNTAASAAKAREVLYRLVDEGSITPEVFEALKENPIPSQPTNNVYQQPTMPQPTNTYYEEDKPIKGTALGFVLAFFLSLIGLVLALVLGDQKCKKAATITFIVEVVAGIIIGIIAVVLVFTIGDDTLAQIGSGSLTLGY